MPALQCSACLCTCLLQAFASPSSAAHSRSSAASELPSLTATTCRFVGGLTGLHTYFITTNRTTYEHFRARYGGTGNPYNRHCPRNWGEVCFTPLAPRIPENLVIPVSLLELTCPDVLTCFGSAQLSASSQA